jgi:hypothetical protein
MNVLVRSKRSEKGNGRRPRASVLHPSPRPEDRGTQPEAAAAASAAEPQRPAVAPGRSRRDHLPLQDHALYSCQCGFVFEAAVCTTVDCPHCGSGQAW